MEKEYLTLEDTLRLTASFFRRRFRAIVVFFIAGILLGVLIHQYPKTYIGSFTIETHSVPANVFSEITLSINQAIDQGQYDFLTSRCKCSDSVAASMGLIESAIFQNTNSRGSESAQVRITIKMSEPLYAQQIERCILDIFSSNHYVQKQAELYSRSRKDMARKIVDEIAELDSFQNQYYEYIKGNRPPALGVYANGSHTSMLAMIEKNAQIEREIEIGAPFYQLTQLITPSKPTFGLSASLLLGSFVGLFMGFIISLVMEAKLMLAKP